MLFLPFFCFLYQNETVEEKGKDREEKAASYYAISLLL